jgi:hypothetical protein
MTEDYKSESLKHERKKMTTVIDFILVSGVIFMCAAALFHKKRRWGENK